MEGFVKGDVVVIPFPFSDLTGAKRRPALVIANLKNEGDYCSYSENFRKLISNKLLWTALHAAEFRC